MEQQGLASDARRSQRELTSLTNMVLGVGLIESLHGAGSPQAQRITIFRHADLEAKKKLSKDLAGIKEKKS